MALFEDREIAPALFWQLQYQGQPFTLIVTPPSDEAMLRDLYACVRERDDMFSAERATRRLQVAVTDWDGMVDRRGAKVPFTFARLCRALATDLDLCAEVSRRVRLLFDGESSEQANGSSQGNSLAPFRNGSDTAPNSIPATTPTLSSIPNSVAEPDSENISASLPAN